MAFRNRICLTFFAKRQSASVSGTTIGSSPLRQGEDIPCKEQATRTYRCKIACAHNESVRENVGNAQPAMVVSVTSTAGFMAKLLTRRLHPPGKPSVIP